MTNSEHSAHEWRIVASRVRYGVEPPTKVHDEVCNRCGADKPPNKPMSDHVWERLEEEQRRLGTVTELAV